MEEPNYSTACFNCGATNLGTNLMPHRNKRGAMVGMIFSCEYCWKKLADAELIISIKGEMPRPQNQGG
ncbi:MAG: hypothetical protein WC503_01235 [Candidatus Shapirobacteria bacterium]